MHVLIVPAEIRLFSELLVSSWSPNHSLSITCLEFFYPRMSQGGIILIDEYNDPSWPGCNKAVDEFIQTNSAKLSRIEDNNYVKYFIKKSD